MSPQSHGLEVLFQRSHVDPSPLARLNEHQSDVLRFAAISASVVSIFAGLVGFYFLGAIDARRRVFRHHLVFFLIAYDFLKAVTLLFYPARVALVHHAYYNGNFCDIVGFFTAMAIEGADIAIFSFAIHTAILVFAPNRKYKNGDKVEGGLYPYRWYVWILSILVPVVLASLAFVNNVGYQPLVNWCYLPERPRWYRLVLSWVPRYVVVITILCIYVGIYLHVMRQFNEIMYIHEDINNKQSHRLKFDRHFFINLRYLMKEFAKGHFNRQSHGESASITDVEESFEDPNKDNPDMLKKQLHQATMDSFDQRRIQIQRQMKSIFVYPISYIFLWLAPFALQCIQYDYELEHGPVYWLTAISAFMQPFNCTIDTIVFVLRERPWTYTVSEVSKKIESKHGQVYANDLYANYYKTHETWRRWVSWLPLYQIPNTVEVDKKQPRKQQSTSANPHDFSNMLSSWDENEFRAPQISESRNNSGTSYSLPPSGSIKGIAQTPSSPINGGLSNSDITPQKRSDTVISTTDFYNIPHRAHTMNQSEDRKKSEESKKQNEERKKSDERKKLWEKFKEPKDIFNNYEMKEITPQQKQKETQEVQPPSSKEPISPIRVDTSTSVSKSDHHSASPKLPSRINSISQAFKKKGSILRKNTAPTVEPPEESDGDDSSVSFMEFLNRGPGS